MKIYALLITLFAFGTGCHVIHDQVPGSGKTHTEKRSVGAFTAISTVGAFEIEVIVNQSPQSIEIEGDDNVLPLVGTEVTNKVLHVSNLRGYSVAAPIFLRISVPDLAGIDSSGAGTIAVSGLKSESFKIVVNGAPTVRVSGETQALKINANGAAKIDTNNLRAARVEVDAKGVSSIEVFAADQLKVTVSGPSRVIYQGDAVVDQTVNGPGRVEKKESGGS